MKALWFAAAAALMLLSDPPSAQAHHETHMTMQANPRLVAAQRARAACWRELGGAQVRAARGATRRNLQPLVDACVARRLRAQRARPAR